LRDSGPVIDAARPSQATNCSIRLKCSNNSIRGLGNPTLRIDSWALPLQRENATVTAFV